LSHRFVTTADAKIPLSVVQVKHEPQYVVFSSPYLAPSSATPDFRCAKPKIAASSAIFLAQNLRNLRQTGRRSRASFPQPSPPRALPQDAEVVQFNQALCKLWTTRTDLPYTAISRRKKANRHAILAR
jgi:hypothetical protein